jgi:hypothetical protein
VVKLLVCNDARMEFLHMLNLMNVNHLTSFPDIDAPSTYCNVLGEIEKYLERNVA